MAATTRRRLVLTSLACVVVLVAALAAGRAASSWRADTRPSLTAALANVPADTAVLAFTDWARLRAGVGVARAAERDGTTVSVLAAAGDLDGTLGWDLDDVDWEAFAQSRRAAATVVGVRAGFDWDATRDAMAASGWTGSGDVWEAGPDATARLEDELAQVRLVPSRGVVVLGDVAAGTDAAAAVVRGEGRALTAVRAMADTAAALAGSDSVLLQAGRLGCGSAAMPEGEPTDQARAAQERVGELRPVTATGRALTDHGGSGFAGQTMRFASTYDAVATGREQVGVRAALATGPFIGRTGDVEDTLRLRSTAVRGATAVLTMAHDPRTDAFMAGDGPALFATC